jgi:hypothetical protein
VCGGFSIFTHHLCSLKYFINIGDIIIYLDMGTTRTAASPDREHPEPLVVRSSPVNKPDIPKRLHPHPVIIPIPIYIMQRMTKYQYANMELTTQRGFIDEDFISRADEIRLLGTIYHPRPLVTSTPVSHSKRRHNSSDRESAIGAPTPKRKSPGDRAKKRHKKVKRESASPTPAVKAPRRAKRGHRPKKVNQEIEQAFIKKAKSSSSMSASGSQSPFESDWQPDFDIEGTSLPHFPSVELVQDQADSFMGGPEATRRQYRELEALTERAIVVKQDLEAFLRKYDESGYKHQRGQTLDPFAAGGLNNPLKIEDDDDDISQVNSVEESSTESNVLIAEDIGR